MSSIPKSTRQQVLTDADHCCQYCRTSSRLIGMPLILDHIMPQSLGGTDDRKNLAASCYRCNEFKGARFQGLDSKTGELALFFNPYTQVWEKHFAWANGGSHIVGLTANGRVTVIALKLNNEYVVEARGLWIAKDWHPPE